MSLERGLSEEVDGEEEDGAGDNQSKGDEDGAGKISGLDSFPVDDTPTPTRILKLANDLFPDFHDPKENPFDAHFRKATEAVKSGTDRLSASIAANDIPSGGNGGDDSLNTPSIFPGSALNTPTPTTKRSPVKPTLGRSQSRPLKPLLPNVPLLPTVPPRPYSQGSDSAQVLLKMPSGDTFMMYNLPLLKNQDKETEVSKTSKTSKRTDQEELADPDDSLVDKKKEELKERNRYSAFRSRNRKKEAELKLQHLNRKLITENSILRDEIVQLKKILQEHASCDVTLSNNQQDTIRGLSELQNSETPPQYIHASNVLHVDISQVEKSQNFELSGQSLQYIASNPGRVLSLHQPPQKEAPIQAQASKTDPPGGLQEQQHAALGGPKQLGEGGGRSLDLPDGAARDPGLGLTSPFEAGCNDDSEGGPQITRVSLHQTSILPASNFTSSSVTSSILPSSNLPSSIFSSSDQPSSIILPSSSTGVTVQLDTTAASNVAAAQPFTPHQATSSLPHPTDQTDRNQQVPEAPHAKSCQLSDSDVLATTSSAAVANAAVQPVHLGRPQPVNLIEIRSPPQAFPEDLTLTKRIAVAERPGSPKGATGASLRNLKRTEGDSGRRKRGHPRSLSDKLEALKRKMNEDRETDQFLDACRLGPT